MFKWRRKGARDKVLGLHVGCIFGVFGAFLGCTNVHFCTHPISQLRNFLLDEKVPVLGLHRGLGQQHAIVQKLYLYHWHVYKAMFSCKKVQKLKLVLALSLAGVIFPPSIPKSINS